MTRRDTEGYGRIEKISFDPYNEGASLQPAASLKCGICGASLSSKTITVNLKTVSVYQWLSGGYDAEDIKKLDKYYADYYPSFIKVSSAPSMYNCHSYAWYKAEENIYWIDDPSPIYSNTSYWSKWRIPMRNIQAGDRIIFWSDDALLHSAIVDSLTTCTSKLGHAGVYTTTISEMQSYYGSSKTEAYLPFK